MSTWMALALLAGGCSDYELHPGTEPEVVIDDTADPIVDTDARTAEDDFTVPVRTDVVVFGDTSDSMTEELATMADNVGRFLDRLASAGSDWQIAAITGPDGCANGGVLTPDTPDYQRIFEEGITRPPGEDLIDEWGLASARAAVEQVGSGGCNQGLLRHGAALHVVFISDEDDNSPGWDTSDGYWRDYVAAIQSSKGDPDLVRISTVGGPLPDGCSGAEPALGYADAVDVTGGLFLSICEDWAADLPTLADVSTIWTTFPLTRVPIVDTIEVRVDGGLRASGWAWEEEGNLVRISEDPPVSGQEVAISYGW
jgi:hypothetical protein